MLIEANGLDPDDFKCWVFSPGMLFDAPNKWWDDYGRRDFPREGMDFCLYRAALLLRAAVPGCGLRALRLEPDARSRPSDLEHSSKPHLQSRQLSNPNFLRYATAFSQSIIETTGKHDERG